MEKKKILVVDDEHDALLVLSSAISAREYDVITADNGPEAVRLARREHPDLIILDIMMPEMDGTVVAAQLKERPDTSDIPIIFLTGLVTKSEEYCHDAVNHVFIAKPYDVDDLMDQIGKIMPVAAGTY